MKTRSAGGGRRKKEETLYFKVSDCGGMRRRSGGSCTRGVGSAGRAVGRERGGLGMGGVGCLEEDRGKQWGREGRSRRWLWQRVLVGTACPREEGKVKACEALGPGLAMGVLVVGEERKEEN